MVCEIKYMAQNWDFYVHALRTSTLADSTSRTCNWYLTFVQYFLDFHWHKFPRKIRMKLAISVESCLPNHRSIINVK